MTTTPTAERDAERATEPATDPDTEREPTPEPERTALVDRLRAAHRLVRRDLLLQNSLFIMGSTALMGALGFCFWVLCAHLFDPAAIGVGSTLITGGSLIAYVALFGFNATFVAFLPTAPDRADRDRQINTGITIVAVASIVGAVIYVIAAPRFAPELLIIRQSPLTVLAFVGLSAATALNLLTDSFFIGMRSARYNFLVDGVVQSGIKLALPLALVGAGAFGIFASSGLAAVAALALSLGIMARRFRFRLRPAIDADVIRRTFRFATTTYASSLLNLVPLFVLPMLVLRELGGAEAGYFYMAFQIAMLVNAIPFAITQSMFAEGSQHGADLAALTRRSARLTAMALVPCVVVLIAANQLVLRPFGGEYQANAAGALVVFALGCPAVAFNTWSSMLVRLSRQLTMMVWSNVVYAVVVCGLAALWVDRGVAWVAAAWLVGNLVSALVAFGAFVGRDRASDRAQQKRMAVS